MKRMVQRHTIVKSHVDGKNVNTTCRNVRDYFLKLGSRVVAYWCCNDKNKVKVGPPGEPYALATRSVRRWIPKDAQFESVCHDLGIKVSLTPSMILNIIEPRDNRIGSFHKGQVTLWLKDVATQGFEPFRHVTELINDRIGKKCCNVVLQIN